MFIFFKLHCIVKCIPRNYAAHRCRPGIAYASVLVNPASYKIVWPKWSVLLLLEHENMRIQFGPDALLGSRLLRAIVYMYTVTKNNTLEIVAYVTASILALFAFILSASTQYMRTLPKTKLTETRGGDASGSYQPFIRRR